MMPCASSARCCLPLDVSITGQFVLHDEIATFGATDIEHFVLQGTQYGKPSLFVSTCKFECVCACVRACVRVCVRARACVSGVWCLVSGVW
jgi:hypothetical protein